MNAKTKKILSTVILAIPALVMVFSAVGKLSGQQMVVDGLSKIGYGPYIPFLGIAELVFAVLLFVPKTRKIGFLFTVCYLSAAAAIEIVGGNPPMALVFVALAWIGMYIRDKYMFVAGPVQAE